LDEAAVNLRALGFALLLSMGATLVFGVVPAIALIRRSLTADLRAGDRGSSGASRLMHRLLVVSEVALAASLLIGSGLLIRTVARMTDVPVGVGNTTAAISSVQLSGATYAQWADVATTFGTILERLREQPGVRAAGGANFLPLEPGWRVPFWIEGRPAPANPNDTPQAQYHTVTEGYFEAIGAPLVSGRAFTARDTADAPGVVIVNETFANQHLAVEPSGRPVLLSGAAGIGPLGRNLLQPSQSQTVHAPRSRFEIVGVVADIRNTPLGQPVEPAVYFTARQFPFRAMFVAMDTTDVPTAVGALRNTLRAVAPGIPTTETSTWADRHRLRTAEPRLLMTVLVFFGALAALLASLGVYGLFSWTVALRKRELAIRLTLGAHPVGVGAMVLRQAALLVSAGLIVGWVVTQFAHNALSRVLFEVSPNDVRTLSLALGVLAMASIVAGLPPALRAMRVDPLDGLRD
ncbi:MAG TPA: ABC transporter permease, partial [Vicinamibacterales bacterium]|nr:ABC transporter permease [Vicinamibacterales bacterium]